MCCPLTLLTNSVVFKASEFEKWSQSALEVHDDNVRLD